jgi:hypothetical protein
MKIMISYCKNPKAKINAIVDLAKGFRNNSFIDMTPVRLFFLFEVPFKFTMERSKELILNILERLKQPLLLS